MREVPARARHPEAHRVKAWARSGGSRSESSTWWPEPQPATSGSMHAWPQAAKPGAGHAGRLLGRGVQDAKLAASVCAKVFLKFNPFKQDNIILFRF